MKNLDTNIVDLAKRIENKARADLHSQNLESLLQGSIRICELESSLKCSRDSLNGMRYALEGVQAFLTKLRPILSPVEFAQVDQLQTSLAGLVKEALIQSRLLAEILEAK